MVKWEYYGFEFEEPWRLTELMSKAGEDGWELVTVYGKIFIFKRPKNG